MTCARQDRASSPNVGGSKEGGKGDKGIESGQEHEVLLDRKWGLICPRQGRDTQPVRN